MDFINKYRNLSKNTILYAINSIGGKLAGFLLIPLYTSVLSSNDYGMSDVLMVTVQLLVPLLTLNIQDAVIRFTLDEECDKQKVLNIGINIVIKGGTILSVSLLLARITEALLLDLRFVCYIIFAFLINAFNNIASFYLRAQNRVTIIVLAGLSNTVITCLCSIVFLLYYNMGVYGYLFANIMGALTSSLFYLFFNGIYREIMPSTDSVLTKTMVFYSLPLAINTIAWWINNASDRYILTLLLDSSANGIYAVSNKIPSILSSAQTVFYNAWSVSVIMNFDKADKDGFIGNVYSFYSEISVLVCSFLLIINKPIATILYAKEFYDAWRYVPPLLVGMVFCGLSLFEGCFFTAVKDTKKVSYTTIVGAIINLFLNMFLIPITGIIGASIATMISYIVTWVIRVVLAQRIITMKVKWRRHFLLYLLLIIQASSSIIFDALTIQYILFIVIVFCMKGEIHTFLKSVARKI